MMRPSALLSIQEDGRSVLARGCNGLKMKGSPYSARKSKEVDTLAKEKKRKWLNFDAFPTHKDLLLFFGEHMDDEMDCRRYGKTSD